MGKKGDLSDSEHGAARQAGLNSENVDFLGFSGTISVS